MKNSGGKIQAELSDKRAALGVGADKDVRRAPGEDGGGEGA